MHNNYAYEQEILANELSRFVTQGSVNCCSRSRYRGPQIADRLASSITVGSITSTITIRAVNPEVKLVNHLLARVGGFEVPELHHSLLESTRNPAEFADYLKTLPSNC